GCCPRAERAQRQRAVGLFDAAPGHFQVLSPERLFDLRDGQVVSPQLVAVEIDVDLALAPADDQNLADAVDRFDLTPQRLVGVLGHLAQAAVRRDRDGHDRRGVRVELFNRRLLDVVRQIRQRAVDLVANVLGGFVKVALQLESHEDQRDAFGRGRTQFVNAADGVDGLFDLVGDLGLDLLRRGARQSRGDGNGREFDTREALYRQPVIREDAQYHQRHYEHRGEDRATDTNFGEFLHDFPVWDIGPTGHIGLMEYDL